MGYKLYASMGTADYYTEHGVDVSYFILFYFSNLAYTHIYINNTGNDKRLKKRNKSKT